LVLSSETDFDADYCWYPTLEEAYRKSRLIEEFECLNGTLALLFSLLNLRVRIGGQLALPVDEPVGDSTATASYKQCQSLYRFVISPSQPLYVGAGLKEQQFRRCDEQQSMQVFRCRHTRA
jgi:hypothetical protein